MTGRSARSRRAVTDLRRLCAVHLGEDHDIEVVDVLLRPEVALEDGVIATPAVRRLLPPSTRRVVGDLADSRLAAIALELAAERVDPADVDRTDQTGGEAPLRARQSTVRRSVASPTSGTGSGPSPPTATTAPAPTGCA